MCFRKPFAAFFSILIVIAAACSLFGETSSVEVIDLAATFQNQPSGLADRYGDVWSSLSNVSISGRVKTPEGRPIKGASIVLKDADTSVVVRTAVSSAFGYYRLDQIETGRLYVLSVSHKNYLFALPASLLDLNEDRTGVDFTGEANE